MSEVARDRSFDMGRQLLHDELTHSVIGAFYEVYNTLSHGYLESIYLAALEREYARAAIALLESSRYA